MRQSIRAGRLLLCAAVAGLGWVATSADAAVFTYNRAATATDNWNDGVAASWDAKPTQGTDTTLVFGSSGTPLVINTSGTVIDSINNLAGGDVNANGRFELNRIVAGYRGLSTNTAPNNVAPLVTISGGALELLNDGATTPEVSLRSNANSTGTINQKVILTLANDLYLNSTSLKLLGQNATPATTGGVAGGAIRVTGALNFVNTQAHTIEFSGDEGASVVVNAAGRNHFGSAIADSGVGNATSVVKSGTSMWELASASTYTGGTDIQAGILRASSTSGFGTGSVSVASGAQAYLASAGDWNYDFSIAGNGAGSLGAILMAANNAVLPAAHTVTLTANARIGGQGGTGNTVRIDSKITGAFDLSIGSASANTPLIIVSNPNNDYTGNTSLNGENATTTSSSSTSAMTVRLGASEVFSDGNLTLNMGTRANQNLQLFGFDQTVGGLNSSGNGLLTRVITNGAAAGTASTLTVGADDANGVYRGQLTGSSTATLALTKIGAGNQVLAGTSTYYGNTTIDEGTLTLSYDLYATAQSNSVSNTFSQNSTLVLNGGTLAIDARSEGLDVTKAGTLSGRNFTLGALEDTSGLVAGQLITAVTSTSGPIFIAGIDQATKNINLSDTPSPSITSMTAVAQSAGVTSQAFKGLTLGAASAVVSTIDFGGDSVVLTFSSAPVQINDGSILSIANWSGDMVNGGGTDQLRFIGAPLDFSSVFAQSEVVFQGYGTGYAIIDFGGNYEVVPIPEPAALGLVGLAGLAGLSRRRRTR